MTLKRSSRRDLKIYRIMHGKEVLQWERCFELVPNKAMGTQA